MRFLSTLSLRRATGDLVHISALDGISIHALLAESDSTPGTWSITATRFLSTLSLRRATHKTRPGQYRFWDFYPRSPCGERRLARGAARLFLWISIHALLAESDLCERCMNPYTIKFLSTLSLRRATDLQDRVLDHARFLSTLSLRRATIYPVKFIIRLGISIHALLAESDKTAHRAGGNKDISIHALLAESDSSSISVPR